MSSGLGWRGRGRRNRLSGERCVEYRGSLEGTYASVVARAFGHVGVTCRHIDGLKQRLTLLPPTSYVHPASPMPASPTHPATCHLSYLLSTAVSTPSSYKSQPCQSTHRPSSKTPTLPPPELLPYNSPHPASLPMNLAWTSGTPTFVVC